MNWTEFIEFISSILYLYIAWLSGISSLVKGMGEISEQLHRAMELIK